jgi:hypothetical protein
VARNSFDDMRKVMGIKQMIERSQSLLIDKIELSVLPTQNAPELLSGEFTTSEGSPWNIVH